MHTPESSPNRLSRRSRSTITALTAFALLFGAALVGAPPATAAATGSIAGVVTSGVDGSKLDGIAVALLPEFAPTTSYDRYVDYDETNSQGKFSFSGVTPGRYRVFFDTEDRDYIPQFLGGTPGDLEGQIAPIVVGTTTIDASQALSVGGTYSGHIENAAGKALKDVSVYAVPLDESAEDYYDYDEDYTDNNGDFEIGGLWAGEYTLEVFSDEANLVGQTIELAPIVGSAEVEVEDIVLAVGAKLSGIVKDAAGKPVKGAAIIGQGFNADGTPSVSSYGYDSTDKNGAYSLNRLPKGNIQVSVLGYDDYTVSQDFAGGSDEAYLSVPVNIPKAGSGNYRDLRLAKSASISGIVKDAAGKLAKNVPVQVIQNDATAEGIFYGDDFLSASTPSRRFEKSVKAAKAAKAASVEPVSPESALKVIDFVRTDKHGKYSVRGLTPGSYSLSFGSNQSGDKPGAVSAKTLFLAASAKTLNVRLSKTVTVSGVVKSSAGKALRYADVQAIRVGGGSKADILADSFGAHATSTDKKGKYSLGLPAGTWILKFSSDYNSVGTRYLGGGTYASAPSTTKLVVKSTSLKKNISLPITGANVAANVVTAEGLKNAGGQITLERLISGKVVDRTVSYTDYWDDWEETSGFNSTLPLKRLADGDYRVVLTPTSYYDNWAIAPTSVPFTVAGAKITKISGKAVAATSTLGTVRLATPTAVPAVDAAVSVSGAATVGGVLTAKPAGLPADAEVYYTWLRDGNPIMGGFSKSYRVQPSDAGKRLSVAISVYTTDSFYEATSDETAKVTAGTYPVEAGAPKVSGSGRVGSTLSAPAGTKAKYQWLVNGFAIPAATSRTFAVRIADFGDSLSVKVSVNGKGWATSAPVTVRSGNAVTLTGKAAVKVVGKAGAKPVLGSALFSTTTGVPGNAIVQSYQWQVNRGTGWQNLSGKIGPSLGIPKTAAADYAVGYSYRVVQTIERSATTTGPAITSSALKLVK